jgi:uncharacterized protein YraI
MYKPALAALAAMVLSACVGAGSATSVASGRYAVSGVEADDMLKMRAGPGTDFNVILGLPNGTVLQVHSCQPTGGTRWCRVSLDGARGIEGHVSWAYLHKI